MACQNAFKSKTMAEALLYNLTRGYKASYHWEIHSISKEKINKRKVMSAFQLSSTCIDFSVLCIGEIIGYAEHNDLVKLNTSLFHYKSFILFDYPQ